MSQKLEAFIVTEQLSGRDVKSRVNEKTGKEWYSVNYPELRQKDMFSNVSFNNRVLTLSMMSYEGTKIKHIIDTKLSDFKHKVHVQEERQETTTKNGLKYNRNFDIVSLLFIDEDVIVDCWNRIFTLLFQEDYLEQSARLLEEAVSNLKMKGKFRWMN